MAAVLGMAQLVVMIIALTPSMAPSWSLQELIAASAFAQWAGLSTAVVWCTLRTRLLNLPVAIGISLACLVPACVGMFGAWALQQIDLGLGYGLTLPIGRMHDFVLGIGALSALIGAIALRYFFVRDQWQAQVQAHAQAAMDALQARIRPHFLFNSMNTIASLVRRDPITAERAIEDLSDLFRAALGADRGDASLAEEIELGQRYLAIESLRLGDRLKVRWQLPEALPTLRLPRLIVQPLLENAVVHGISRLPEGGEISIAIDCDEKTLRLCVSNPTAPGVNRGQHNGHALESIKQRLRHRFGAAVGFEIDTDGTLFVCTLHLPLS